MTIVLSVAGGEVGVVEGGGHALTVPQDGMLPGPITFVCGGCDCDSRDVKTVRNLDLDIISIWLSYAWTCNVNVNELDATNKFFGRGARGEWKVR